MTNSILRKDYFTLDRNEHYVRTFNREERANIIQVLEADGYFFPEKWASKEECISTFLPLAINTQEKTIRHMGNVTCAAAAASGGCILNTDEFFQIYIKA